MKTSILILALLLATTALAFAPTAEARNVCTYGTGDPCDQHAVCVWADGAWTCAVNVDCFFTCANPW